MSSMDSDGQLTHAGDLEGIRFEKCWEIPKFLVEKRTNKEEENEVGRPCASHMDLRGDGVLEIPWGPPALVGR